MHFVSLWKCAAVMWIPPWFSRAKQKYSAWRETNPDDFLSPGFEVLWYCSSTEPQRARPGHAWVASVNHRTDNHFLSIYHMLWKHINMVSKIIIISKHDFRPKVKRERTIVDLILKNPHPIHTTFAACLPHPIQTMLDESPVSSLIQ